MRWPSTRAGGCLPDLPELVGELTAPTYTFVRGQFQLEDKDQVKARLGRSPDLGDALALTFAVGEHGVYSRKLRALLAENPAVALLACSHAYSY